MRVRLEILQSVQEMVVGEISRAGEPVNAVRDTSDYVFVPLPLTMN